MTLQASAFSVCFYVIKCRQIKDILKGALRFNQSQLEAEENEEITIADDHYTSTAAATETSLDSARHHGERLQGGDGTQSRDFYLDRGASTDEKDEEETATTPPEQQVIRSSVLLLTTAKLLLFFVYIT